jgi:hypothetical protein
LPNCWKPFFLVLPKLDECQVDLPNFWIAWLKKWLYKINNVLESVKTNICTPRGFSSSEFYLVICHVELNSLRHTSI